MHWYANCSFNIAASSGQSCTQVNSQKNSADSMMRDNIELAMHVLYYRSVLSKVDDFATFKKVEVHAKNSTF